MLYDFLRERNYIKQRIQYKLFEVLIRMIRYMRFKGIFHTKDGRSALILPAASPGSLGDDAMLSATVHHLRNKGCRRIGLIFDGLTPKFRYSASVDQEVNIEGYFCSNRWRDKIRFVLIAARYHSFYAIGADVLDGYYSDHQSYKMLRLVSLSADTGLDTTILGFSFNQQPRHRSLRALQQLPRDVKLCARDPISQQRLREFAGRPVELVADLAFLLQSNPNTNTVRNTLSWINKQVENENILFGMNANRLHAQVVQGRSVVNIVKMYREAIVDLCKQYKNICFVFIPHDFRGEDNDLALAVAIYESLPHVIKDKCFIISTACGPAEIKAICGRLHFVLSGRMHLAIACLSQRTPVACISYQGKFTGLFKFFGLEEFVIDPEEALKEGCLADKLSSLIKRRAEATTKIAEKLPEVLMLAEKNFGSSSEFRSR